MSSINASRHALDGKKRVMYIIRCYRSMKERSRTRTISENPTFLAKVMGKIVCNKLGISLTETRFPAIDVMVTLNPWRLRIAITFHRNYFHAPFPRGADYISNILHTHSPRTTHALKRSFVPFTRQYTSYISA